MKIDISDLNPQALLEALGAAIAAMHEIDKNASPLFKGLALGWSRELGSLSRRIADAANGDGK